MQCYMSAAIKMGSGYKLEIGEILRKCEDPRKILNVSFIIVRSVKKIIF